MLQQEFPILGPSNPGTAELQLGIPPQHLARDSPNRGQPASINLPRHPAPKIRNPKSEIRNYSVTLASGKNSLKKSRSSLSLPSFASFRKCFNPNSAIMLSISLIEVGLF